MSRVGEEERKVWAELGGRADLELLLVVRLFSRENFSIWPTTPAGLLAVCMKMVLVLMLESWPSSMMVLMCVRLSDG